MPKTINFLRNIVLPVPHHYCWVLLLYIQALADIIAATILPNIDSYTQGWYILKWTVGFNSQPYDGFPQPSEITQVAQGNLNTGFFPKGTTLKNVFQIRSIRNV